MKAQAIMLISAIACAFFPSLWIIKKFSAFKAEN